MKEGGREGERGREGGRERERGRERMRQYGPGPTIYLC